MDQALKEPALNAAAGRARAVGAGVIYIIAFITGGIVMSFEMLGSRYLNPYFGSGIYTWAALISTVLAALTLGYFLGGWLADRTASVTVLGATVVVASLYFLALPTFSDALLEFLLADIDDVRAGSLVASLAILLFPVTLLGMYSPFAIRLMLHSAERSGTVSGTVYGVSTAGSIVGTLGTTFFLIPLIGTKAITYSLGAAGLICGVVLMALSRVGTRRPAMLLMAGLIAAGAAPAARADKLFDESVRADMLKRPDGRMAHVESEYNDIYVTKRRGELTMSFQLKGWDYTESVTDLRRPGCTGAALFAGHDGCHGLPGRAQEGADARARRRLDLHLSRALHAGDRDRRGRDRSAGDRGRQTVFRPARNRAGALSRRRRPRLSQPQQGPLRPDPARRLSRRVRAVSSADQGILRPAQGAA